MTIVSGFGSAVDAYVEISTNGTSWTNISGATNALEPDPVKRKFGEAYVFGAADPGVTVGKNESVEIKMSVLFTQGASDAFATVKAAFDNKTDVYFRWTPFGNVAGNARFTTGAGKVLEFMYPKINAESADAIMCELKIRAAGITQDATP